MIVKEKVLKAMGAKSSNKLSLLSKKPLYGLNQVSRLWSKLLDSKLRMHDGHVPVLGGTCIVVGVYVDDMLFTCPNIAL